MLRAEFRRKNELEDAVPTQELRSLLVGEGRGGARGRLLNAVRTRTRGAVKLLKKRRVFVETRSYLKA